MKKTVSVLVALVCVWFALMTGTASAWHIKSAKAHCDNDHHFVNKLHVNVHLSDANANWHDNFSTSGHTHTKAIDYFTEDYGTPYTVFVNWSTGEHDSVTLDISDCVQEETTSTSTTYATTTTQPTTTPTVQESSTTTVPLVSTTTVPTTSTSTTAPAVTTSTSLPGRTTSTVRPSVSTTTSTLATTMTSRTPTSGSLAFTGASTGDWLAFGVGCLIVGLIIWAMFRRRPRF